MPCSAPCEPCPRRRCAPAPDAPPDAAMLGAHWVSDIMGVPRAKPASTLNVLPCFTITVAAVHLCWIICCSCAGHVVCSGCAGNESRAGRLAGTSFLSHTAGSSTAGSLVSCGALAAGALPASARDQGCQLAAVQPAAAQAADYRRRNGPPRGLSAHSQYTATRR